jgi:hypothetical protein
MPKLSSSTLRKAIHILIYGDPKTGKSELAGELARYGFTLWYFDFENGSMTLFRSIPKEFHDQVNIFQIPDTKDFPIAIETVLKILKPGKHEICDKHGKVLCPICKDPKTSGTFSVFNNLELGEKDIVIFDSVTQLSNSAMNHIGKGKEDTWKPEWDNFRAQGQMLDRFLSTIQNAPYHVICITHGTEIETNDGKNKIVPIAGSRNFSRNTAKYFDEVVYMEIFNKKHRAASSTTYGLNILTGSRSRTAVEDVQKANLDARLTLLPIFINQGVTQAEVAENILLGVKEQLKLENK